MCDKELHSWSLSYTSILDTNMVFFFVFQAIQVSLLIGLGLEGSQDPLKKKKNYRPIYGMILISY